MATSAPAGLSQAAIVGIAIGAGSLVLIAAAVVFAKIFQTRRKHNLAVAEIERGFGRRTASDIGESLTAAGYGSRSPFRRPSLIPSANNSQAQYSSIGSAEQITHFPKFASPKQTHPATFFDDGQNGSSDTAQAGLVATWKRSRLHRISSRYRHMQPLSAIIESPRSHLARSPVSASAAAAAAFIRVDAPSRAQSDVIAEGVQIAGNGQDLSPADRRASASPSLQAKASTALRWHPAGAAQFGDFDRPKAVRSRSVGTFAGPLPYHVFAGDGSGQAKRTVLHNRSMSHGAQIVGPAPTGPLPPLPSKAAFLAQMNHYSVRTNVSNNSSLSSSPERRWETMISFDSARQSDRILMLEETRQRLEKSASQAKFEKSDGIGPIAALKASARFSTDSTASKRSSISSIRASLDDACVNRLSIPRIETAERLSISRMSSCASVTSNSTLRLVSTPTRFHSRLAAPSQISSGSRVSIYGSPAQRRRALRPVSSNITTSPQRPVSTMQRSSSSFASLQSGSSHMSRQSMRPFQFETAAMPTGKPSAMKGSPGSRKGHKRQNCVRISTLAPTVLGPPSSAGRSRSSSPSIFSMSEIREECGESPGENPYGVRDSSGDAWNRQPHAQRHINGDITLGPRAGVPHSGPTRLRASLTGSSPTLSMATLAYVDHHALPDSASGTSTLSYSPPKDGLGTGTTASRESSVFFIPSFPSPTPVGIAKANRDEIFVNSHPDTPAMTFTRPSSEWNHGDEQSGRCEELSSSPPFALHVTPSHSLPSLYDPEREAKAVTYDPLWPMLETRLHDPPASGMVYDPSREFETYSSPESDSSIDSPIGLAQMELEICSDSIRMGITPPLPVRRLAKPEMEGTAAAAKGGVSGEQYTSPPCSPKFVPVYVPSSPPSIPSLSPGGHAVSSALSSHPPFQVLPSSNRPNLLQPLTQSGHVAKLPHRDSDKENSPMPESPTQPVNNFVALPSATSLSDPLKSASILKPNAFASFSRTIAALRPSRPAPLPPSCASQLDVPCKEVSDDTNEMTKTTSNALTGPRPAPARDLRRAIMELRRGNSEMMSPDSMSCLESDANFSNRRDANWTGPGFNSDSGDDCGRRKYLKLGREASPLLPFVGFDTAGEDDVWSGAETYKAACDSRVDEGDFVFDDLDHQEIVCASPSIGETETKPTTEKGEFDFGFNFRPLSVATTSARHMHPQQQHQSLSSEGSLSELELDDPPVDMMVESFPYSPTPSGLCTSGRLHKQDPNASSRGYEPYSPIPRNTEKSLTPVREVSMDPSTVSAKQRTQDLPEHGPDRASVWDDGEQYWQQFQPPASSPSRLDRLRSPRIEQGMQRVAGEMDVRPPKSRKGGVKVDVSGSAGKRSLYDENGILRSPPSRQQVR